MINATSTDPTVRHGKTLLLGRDALLVLDLGLDILDRVVGLHVQGDGLAPLIS